MQTSRPEPTLSREEEDELIAEWQPEPLHAGLTEQQRLDSMSIVTLERLRGTRATVNGRELLNFASANPLAIHGNDAVEARAVEAMRRYGVGSCGPRGFYGTIDTHLRLEERIASFVGTPEAILYSYTFATVTSAISAFAKRGDLVLADSSIALPSQVGCKLARAKTIYFKHNDVADLAAKLEALEKSRRRMTQRLFVLIEGLYINEGDVAPLREILALKAKYCFYLILDETYSIGVLGRSGRGLVEASGCKVEDVDVLIGSLATALASVGGFVCGSTDVVRHQRLNASGYVFSASSPPYLCVAAHEALDMLEEEAESTLGRMRANIALAHRALAQCSHLLRPLPHTSPDSPYMHLVEASPPANASRLELERRLEALATAARRHGVLVARAKYTDDEAQKPRPSLRFVVSAGHTADDIQEAAAHISAAANEALTGASK